MTIRGTARGQSSLITLRPHGLECKAEAALAAQAAQEAAQEAAQAAKDAEAADKSYALRCGPKTLSLR